MSTSGAERVAEAARGMSALLAGDLSLEDLFASFCELLRSLVDADEIEVVVRDADAWLRLRFDGNVRRESGDNLPYNDPTVATVAFGRRMLEVSPARFSMPLRVGDEIVGAFFILCGSQPAFADRDAEVIESLAPYLAVAIWQRWLRKSVERERFRAEHDSLTRLPNRTLFTERLERALLRARRSGTQVGVLFLDLDGFKPINDRYGHEAGDAVLVTVARRLRRTIRETDTAARLGGDEFGVVLEAVGSDSVAAEVAQKISESLFKPIRWGQTMLRITASIGRSISPRDGTDAALLLRRADARMYREKRARTV